MDIRNINKIVGFLEAVAKDGGHNEDHILLMTSVIGIPNIDVGDVERAVEELAEVKAQLEAIEKLRNKIMAHVDEVNKMSQGDMEALPAPAMMIEAPVTQVIELPHTGSMETICMGQ
jgi:hypothetical protein